LKKEAKACAAKEFNWSPPRQNLHCRRMLSLLATASDKATPLEKLQNISGQFWLKVILGIIVFAAVVFLFKKLAGMNKIILTIVLFVICCVVGVNWVYNRSEPAIFTPIVDAIASTGFFPTKGTYENKQQQDPTAPGAKKDAPPSKTSPAGPNTQPAKK
jgi:hypothetical protein